MTLVKQSFLGHSRVLRSALKQRPGFRDEARRDFFTTAGPRGRCFGNGISGNSNISQSDSRSTNPSDDEAVEESEEKRAP